MNWLFSPSTYRQRQRRRTLARVGTGAALIAGGGGLAFVVADRYSTPDETVLAVNSPPVTLDLSSDLNSVLGSDLAFTPTTPGEVANLTRDLALAPGLVTEVAVTAEDAPAAAEAAPGATSDWLARGAFGPAPAAAGPGGWSDFELSIGGPGFGTLGVGSDARRDGPPPAGGEDSVAVFMGLSGGVMWPQGLFDGIAIGGAAADEGDEPESVDTAK